VHPNGDNASGAPARSTPGPGPARPERQSVAPVAHVVMIIGGIGILYGAVTATQRYGLTPWALLGSYVAVVLTINVMVTLAPCWRRSSMLLASALTIPCAAFAGYGMIHLASAA
jgi:hypothetical protein